MNSISRDPLQFRPQEFPPTVVLYWLGQTWVREAVWPLQRAPGEGRKPRHDVNCLWERPVGIVALPQPILPTLNEEVAGGAQQGPFSSHHTATIPPWPGLSDINSSSGASVTPVLARWIFPNCKLRWERGARAACPCSHSPARRDPSPQQGCKCSCQVLSSRCFFPLSGVTGFSSGKMMVAYSVWSTGRVSGGTWVHCSH